MGKIHEKIAEFCIRLGVGLTLKVIEELFAYFASLTRALLIN